MTWSVPLFAQPRLDGVDFQYLVPGGLNQVLGFPEMRLHDLDVANTKLKDSRRVLVTFSD